MKSSLFCLVLVASLLAACASGSQLSIPDPSNALPNPTEPQASLPTENSTHLTTPAPEMASPTLAPPTSAAQETQPTEATATPEPGIPNPQPPTSNTRYHLSARLDYSYHRLEVDETITYTNNIGEELNDLVLAVESNVYPGGFQLASLDWSGGQAITDYQLESNRLRIPLPQPLPAGQALQIHIAYTSDLPEIPPLSEEARPRPFGYTARQTNLVDWYPFLPPYRPGQGWLIHHPWFFGEHQVYDVADYQVEVELIEPQYISEDPSGAQKLTVAASALPQVEGDRSIYELDNARSFAWSVSPQYQVYSQTVGEVTVLSYTFPYYPAAGQAALQYTAEALALYNRIYGPYPHASLSVVAADFLDGMEYDGLYFLSRGFYNLYDGTPQGYLTAIAAHETAHQWWYGLVGNDQALEPWLDEALCTFSELLFYEHTYPDLVSWWWEFRVNYYQPVGQVDGAIYDYQGFRPYRDAVYLRGAQFLDALRQQIGQEAMESFLSDYATRMAHKQATALDFFAILKEHTSIDFSDIIKPYFKALP